MLKLITTISLVKISMRKEVVSKNGAEIILYSDAEKKNGQIKH